ncbi:MAG: glycosyltransferase, partial [Acutalibacteraceae bacterium]|nr:glycosyltransferase [Acutalibacteraceae bacterium]
MNILFCGDANMQKGIYLSSLSISHNNSSPLNVYVLTSDAEGYNAIPSGFAEQLETALFRHNKESRARVINISGIFGDYLPKANMNTRFTPLCMLRLFADKIPEIPNKILYLDGDVLCRKDISQLYDMDISQTEIAGVPDRYGKWFFGNILKHNYLNSGVLLM